MAVRRDGEDTRRRILASACEVFAEKGFRGATHAEICRRSKANTAAINYHFRSKESLYVEAFKVALAKSLDKHPADGGVPANAEPEQRLRGRISALINRIADPENKVFDMLHKEMSEQTGLLKEPMDKTISVIRSGMREVIAELLGPKAREREVKLCLMSVMAQCLHPAIHEKRRKGGGSPPPEFKVELSAEELAAHACEFCLGAVKSIRKRLEAPRCGHGPYGRR